MCRGPVRIRGSSRISSRIRCSACRLPSSNGHSSRETVRQAYRGREVQRPAVSAVRRRRPAPRPAPTRIVPRAASGGLATPPDRMPLRARTTGRWPRRVAANRNRRRSTRRRHSEMAGVGTGSGRRVCRPRLARSSVPRPRATAGSAGSEILARTIARRGNSTRQRRASHVTARRGSSSSTHRRRASSIRRRRASPDTARRVIAHRGLRRRVTAPRALLLQVTARHGPPGAVAVEAVMRPVAVAAAIRPAGAATAGVAGKSSCQ